MDTLLTQWARLLLSSLADAGVREIVVTPGSRNTPFVVAAVAEPRLRVHSVIDERAAGFFALGVARATGMPAVVLTTSGTAAAHLYPAVVEAAEAGLPLVALTADRPFEVQDAGAAQTIDQVKLFGSYARRFTELGVPDAAPPALAGVRRLAVRAVAIARGPEPGPVHLNARARKPLEPRTAATDAERALERSVDALLARTAPATAPPVLLPDDNALVAAAAAIRAARRGLVVAGPIPPDDGATVAAAFALARATGFPLLAETTSNLRLTGVPDDIALCDAFEDVLRDGGFVAANRPDVVVRLGGTPASPAWERYALAIAAEDEPCEIVCSAHGVSDPAASASATLRGDLARTLTALVERGVTGDRDPAWADAWTRASESAWKIVDDTLGSGVAHGDALGEPRAVAEVVRRVPPGSWLVAGNSLPVRELDRYARSGSAQVRVLSQRGANGIDGMIAGAAGVAAADPAGAPVTLLTGDVAALHDLTSLALATRTTVPLVIVVLNNGGGRIFEQLPIAAAPGVPDGVMDLLVTPHALTFEHAAAMFGVGYARAETAEGLTSALAAAYARPSCTLVEAFVDPE